MIKLKEYDKEKVLEQKLIKLEQELVLTKKELYRTNEYNKQLEAIVKGVGGIKESKTITIKSATKIEFVQVKNIVCCVADIGYTDVQLQDGRVITATKPLSKFEELLSTASFFRISKSCLINLDNVITFHKDKNQILLQGNILLDVSRRRRVEFLKILG